MRWFAIVCLLTTAAVLTDGESENAVVQMNKGDFEDRVLREFGATKILISSRREEALEDIAATKDQDTIILRDLRLARQPSLGIASLDSTPDLFSTRVTVDAGDLVFSGQIYVNEDTEPAGYARYTLRNLKGSGLIGLDADRDGNFVSTNYFMIYEPDDAELEFAWRDEARSHEQKFDRLYFPDERLRAEIRKAINALFKKRFDAALARVSVNDVFGDRRSKVLDIKQRFGNFYNDVVDELLNGLNKRIEQNGMVQVQLPDLDVPFTYKLLGVNVAGQVLGAEGWLRNLATLVRRGPVSVSFESGNFVVFGSLGLTELRLGYDVCTVKMAGIGPSGDISGTIGKNVVDLVLRINVANRSISLTSFAITELSDINVQFTGLGPFNWLASIIAGRVIDGIKTDALPTIESIIKEQINQVLANLDAGHIILNGWF